METINLINAELRNQMSSTFEIPSLKERRSLEPYELCKVCDDMDRFWVRILEVNKKGDEIIYGGFISNHLISGQTDYGFGSYITFKPENILDLKKGNKKENKMEIVNFLLKSN